MEPTPEQMEAYHQHRLTITKRLAIAISQTWNLADLEKVTGLAEALLQQKIGKRQQRIKQRQGALKK